jgi:L-ascorbate metabolism protein UlaG (beta-lactamase superfamily)
VVITDPVPADSGYKPGKLSADIVTLSNVLDPNYGSTDAVADARALDAPGEYEIGGILVRGIGIRRADGTRNMAFVVEIEGIRIGHVGLPEAASLKPLPDALSDLDILLMPVGGGISLNGPQAADLMTTIDPAVAIPMHYKTEQERLDLESLGKFLSETGAKPEPQARFQATRSGLPSDLTVVVLEPRG